MRKLIFCGNENLIWKQSEEVEEFTNYSQVHNTVTTVSIHIWDQAYAMSIDNCDDFSWGIEIKTKNGVGLIWMVIESWIGKLKDHLQW